MAKITKIEWCDHTWNLVHGCTKISPACSNCYAETISKRYGHKIWGKDSNRLTFGSKYWQQPLSWNKKSLKDGMRRKVFCSSMADIFEDHPTVNQERLKLWPLIKSTEGLDWLLLTKRAENIKWMLPSDWNDGYPNVWLGVTAETEEYVSERIPLLQQVNAVVRFVSAEPLLGPINLEPYLNSKVIKLETCDGAISSAYYPAIDWIIAGGESGPKARPTHPDWIRSLRSQCIKSNIPFFFKQWGTWSPYAPMKRSVKVHVFEPTSVSKYQQMFRAGKKQSGRLLDGRTWEQYPQLGETFQKVQHHENL
jgi:protein gp37